MAREREFQSSNPKGGNVHKTMMEKNGWNVCNKKILESAHVTNGYKTTNVVLIIIIITIIIGKKHSLCVCVRFRFWHICWFTALFVHHTEIDFRIKNVSRGFLFAFLSLPPAFFIPLVRSPPFNWVKAVLFLFKVHSMVAKELIDTLIFFFVVAAAAAVCRTIVCFWWCASSCYFSVNSVSSNRSTAISLFVNKQQQKKKKEKNRV